MNYTDKLNEKMKIEAKELVRLSLGKGRSLAEVNRFAVMLAEETHYQLINNTIGGLSNGRVV